MLILTRRPGETLKIGDDIEVCILGVTGNQVRIGTKAPQAVEVHREEIYRRIHGNRLESNARAVQRYQQSEIVGEH